MGTAELFLLSAGLAADAFSAAVCKGLGMKKINLAYAAVTAVFFGAFQAIMPIIGYMLGKSFESRITLVSNWAALILLGFIGGKMIFESFRGCADEQISSAHLDIRELFMLAVATSIDALAVGILFVTEESNLALSVSVIGAVTFFMSFAGVVVGSRFGSKYGNKAEAVGGIVLILIGLKIFFESGV